MASNGTWPFGCGNWSNTIGVCGEFTDPVVPDLGRCHTYRVKLDCEAPVVPINPAQCGETLIIEYDPNRTPPFSVVGTLFDELCNTITDQNGLTIETAQS